MRMLPPILLLLLLLLLLLCLNGCEIKSDAKSSSRLFALSSMEPARVATTAPREEREAKPAAGWRVTSTF